VTAAARKRRVAVRKLATSHRAQTLVETVFRAWRGWRVAVHRLIQEAAGLAEDHRKRRSVVCSFRRWRRRARRTASVRMELVNLHLRKTRTRRTFLGLRRAAGGAYAPFTSMNDEAMTTPVQENNTRWHPFVGVGSTGVLPDRPDPSFSPGGGMHGIMPPSAPPRTLDGRKRLSTPSASTSTGLGSSSGSRATSAAPSSAQLPLKGAESNETDSPTTPWAKHVANLMEQFDDEKRVADPVAASGVVTTHSNSLAREIFFNSPDPLDTSAASTFEYVSVSSLASISASDDDDDDDDGDGDGDGCGEPQAAGGSVPHTSLARMAANTRSAVPLTTGRSVHAQAAAGSRPLHRGLQPLDANAAAPPCTQLDRPPQADSRQQAKDKRRSGRHSDVRGDGGEPPSNRVLAVALLGAVDAGAAAWRARYLQRTALQAWALRTSHQAEAAALIVQALSLAAFHRLGTAFRLWRRRCLSGGQRSRQSSLVGAGTPADASPGFSVWQDLRDVDQDEDEDEDGDGDGDGDEDDMVQTCLLDSPASQWDDHFSVARAIRTLSDDPSSLEGGCIRSPAGSEQGQEQLQRPPSSPITSPAAFDVEKAMAAIRASQNSRAEATKLLGEKSHNSGSDSYSLRRRHGAESEPF
jgi:hypothetical protein